MSRCQKRQRLCALTTADVEYSGGRRHMFGELTSH